MEFIRLRTGHRERRRPTLKKDVEDNTVLIDGTPEMVLHPPDPDEHFTYVPLALGRERGGAGNR